MDNKFIKEEKRIIDNSQLSFEFSTKSMLNSKSPKSEDSRVISLSDHKYHDKNDTDYSKLVLKFTKSF